MADYNHVDFKGRCNFEGKRGDTWYRNNLSVYIGKDKEGNGRYFNASFFLKADQFDLIPHIENKETIRLEGTLNVNKYVDKNGAPGVSVQVDWPTVTLVDDSISQANELNEDFSDEPF